MKTTGNLGLKKPDGTDIVDITDLNGNMDILDTAVKAVQDHAADTVKHITAAERTAWNAKASTATATASAAGLMAGADKSKLDSVAQGANNYVHPSTHLPSIIVQDTANRFVSDAEKAAWNGKANLSTTPQQTTADLTYFVRTDGNDGNTGLSDTAGGAFRTIQKAINSIPKHVDHAVNVYVQQGVYDEDVKIADFNGNTEIYINGAGALAQASGYSVRSFSLYGCTNQVVIQGFTVTATSRTAFAIANVNFCQIWNSRAVVQTTPIYNGVEATNGSVVRVSSCEISNRSSAIQATQGSTVISVNNIGANNFIGIDAAEGGIIRKAGTQPGSPTPEYATNGGIVTMGVLNPWGDNTVDNRSFSSVYRTSTQYIAASTSTKVTFQVVFQDALGEFSTANNRFTASKAGHYLLTSRLGINSLPDQTYADLTIMLNSGPASNSRLNTSGITSGQQLDICEIIPMNPGDYLELFITSPGALNVEGDPTRGWVRVQRLS
ncbi:hypothetical protein HQN87_25125 [Paenibacillus tritici]|uniref:Pectinesterase catalytic domain-containing protein n=1 Tax=Paenibacillus tritici TaxID=1873425 RepID=A0ABX2DWW9_9BACL|nr:pectinesterase family protein [Paenibacillus tritici]NQX48619.1 hypothetical protein [Paenibacillus tritici]